MGVCADYGPFPRRLCEVRNVPEMALPTTERSGGRLAGAEGGGPAAEGGPTTTERSGDGIPNYGTFRRWDFQLRNVPEKRFRAPFEMRCDDPAARRNAFVVSIYQPRPFVGVYKHMPAQPSHYPEATTHRHCQCLGASHVTIFRPCLCPSASRSELSVL